MSGKQKKIPERTGKRNGIYQKRKGSSIWYLRYTDARGKRRAKKVGKKSDAIKEYKKRKLEMRLKRLLPKPKTKKFKEIVKHGIAYATKHHADPKKFLSAIKVAEEKFGEQNAEKIIGKEIEDWLDELKENRKWSDSTWNRWRA